MVNYQSAHFDESCWDKPHEFIPERFLDEKGKFRRRIDFFPFSLGNFYFFDLFLKKSQFLFHKFITDGIYCFDEFFFFFFVKGKRRCLGETLAKSSIFIFFTYILHNFSLDVPKEHELPRLDGIDGFVVSPRPYMVNLTPRN